MKATGIVRRIDDLGRVVVPKEIRRTLRLREGTPLEIFTDREGEIILKKYSPMMELNAAGGAKKDFFQKPISRALEHVIEERTVIQAGKEDRNFTPVIDDDGDSITAQVITPIICEGDAIGAVIIMSREPRAKFSDPELRLAATAAGFLGRQMES